MLQLEQIKERLSSWISRFSVFTSSVGTWTRFFHPESPQSIRRLQLFWLSCGGMIIVAFAYGMTTFLFEKTPLSKQEEEIKATSTSIETATKK
jgi:S-methylmethionine-dependent homocysteine/selenocysteine methylase